MLMKSQRNVGSPLTSSIKAESVVKLAAGEGTMTSSVLNSPLKRYRKMTKKEPVKRTPDE